MIFQVSGSDSDGEGDDSKKHRRKTPPSTRLSDMTGRRPGSASPTLAPEQGRAGLVPGSNSQPGTGAAMYYSSEFPSTHYRTDISDLWVP